MKPSIFIQITDPTGNTGFIKANSVEGTCREADTGFTRVFVASGGFWRAKESQAEIMAKLRDIQSLIDMEENA